MIHLTDKIGFGFERDVYLHPHNEAQIVKIRKPDSERDANEMEYKYYGSQIKKTRFSPYVAELFGFIDTNFGKGLVSECVRDYDGSISQSLYMCIEKRNLDYQEFRLKFVDVVECATACGIFVRELQPGNILIKRTCARGDFEISIVDGLGVQKYEFKTFVRTHVKILGRKKSRALWRTQMSWLDTWADSVLSGDRSPG